MVFSMWYWYCIVFFLIFGVLLVIFLCVVEWN